MITNQYQIIIVGAGSAGMICAIVAAQKGKKVLVIEKTNEIGGTLHITAGHLSAGGTKRQKEKGIEDNPEAHYDDVMKISRNTATDYIVRLATQKAPELIDWLEEQGYNFDPESPKIIYGHVPYSTPRTYFGGQDYAGKTINGAGTAVLKILQPLWNEQVRLGNITVLLSKQLTKIETDNNLKVISLELNHSEKLQTESSKVVIATGGYASNHDYFKQKHPNSSRLISTAKESSMGEGHQIIEAIGGVFTGANKHTSTLGGLEQIPNSGRTDFWKSWCRVSNAFDRKPFEIYVNAEGKRFMNEGEINADIRERIVLEQPERKFWVIFDNEGLINSEPIIPQFSKERIIEESKLEKMIWQAESIEKLSKKIGLPFNALNQSISGFNDNCKNKKPDQFGRTVNLFPINHGPFFAILTYAFSLISFGGIKVNENLEVVNNEGKTFENLYACGEILGAGATSGEAFCGGMLLTPALSFGKHLGETL